ncbi:membrane protein insertion efficiency factor YidD [Candidatus Falkowbacteria bacterium CG_4_9_14_3_um_filter_36_9]|uniref:Putative membrane protein insertion efficiency factor n=1 Tax=Candidatus Falkowbacteria bacterium CG02_land_8_20_14_3_00_36_14 TaxID=1974560 RepID=A0A2M7DQC6_9BACT|nr:MAG: membrane protein insertion efficiency factor YidD [Candidatus Falkowbacteria bacterium CG02_land_8_20_14_3_00_36_14]PIX12017.1 MAG: membrane protein insertion efficiency factor YidD [Candidatus Falkowbacteria bacterium CG_4_8_14_3_um_filter_36_11]PJA11029.1 MAG: membrane protein insertion efficiency factor YidD [Candidatus Falkowbacteria bacterium CG_4_10_14_0_2_um_filter_36_22]PJB18326.1 MAG: membrane protein insertion efficiency factor YidD [Candidatus Falkowbacteria bacterium CG_4_9_1
MNNFIYFPCYLAIKLIKIYQKIFSFDHSRLKVLYPYGFCRFQPTCSEYAIASLGKYGLIKGGLKSIWRVLRCNPWNKGGWDPVK